MSLAASQENHAVCFEDFYTEEYSSAVRRAYLLLGSREAAEDAVHDSFVQVFLRWDSISEPGPYLSRVVLNRCRDIHQRRERLSHLLGRLYIAHGSEGTDDFLHDVLGRLPFNQRAVVVLKYYADLSHGDIAQVMNCRAGSVGPWLARAHRRLRKELSDDA